jgi:hypothetical protein
MEGQDIHMTSSSGIHSQQAPDTAQSLGRDGGATPDPPTKTSPSSSQSLSDAKPLIARPSTAQVCLDYTKYRNLSVY